MCMHVQMHMHVHVQIHMHVHVQMQKQKHTQMGGGGGAPQVALEREEDAWHAGGVAPQHYLDGQRQWSRRLWGQLA